MLTKLYPMVQFKKDTWEIDEFDCASIFLLIGSEKAMLIDCGMGIGDLRGAIEMLTDKPLIVVITHGHVDHTANARQFDEIWINEKDAHAPIPQSLERRTFDTIRIARRQHGRLDGVYNMFNLYPYDINVDLRDTDQYGPMPKINYLTDGMKFDLGGGRIVTAYDCPGHSPGEMVFLDSGSRSLFCGDALNYNLGVGSVPLETTLRYMKRMESMKDQYDGIWNGHHDFRALGVPLDDDCLPTVIAMMEDALAGHIVPCDTPSFWGEDPRLEKGERKDYWQIAPPARPESSIPHKRVCLRRGRNFLNINPDLIYENSNNSDQ